MEPMTGVAASQVNYRLARIHREVALMTAYEIITIFMGILALLMSFGSLIIALLAFLDRDKDHKRKNNAHPVVTRMGTSHREVSNLLGKLHLWSEFL